MAKPDDIREILENSKTERRSMEWERLYPLYEIAAQLAELNQFLQQEDSK